MKNYDKHQMICKVKNFMAINWTYIVIDCIECQIIVKNYMVKSHRTNMIVHTCLIPYEMNRKHYVCLVSS